MEKFVKILKKLSEDLQDLYCKTNSKAIEASLISVIASAEGLSDGEIVSWLSTAGNKTAITDKKVLNALNAMGSINPAEMGDFNKWLIAISHPKYGGSGLSQYIDYFIIFSEVMDNPQVSLVLRPFYPVLSVMRDNVDIIGKPYINREPVTSDLATIQDQLEKDIGGASIRVVPEMGFSSKTDRFETDRPDMGKETKQDKLQNLYDDVYDWLSEDISNAFSNVGAKGLAEMIWKGDLGNAYALEDYYKETGLAEEYGSPELHYLRKRIVDNKFIPVMNKNINSYIKDQKGHVDLYRAIKEFVMQWNGILSEEEIQRIRRERIKMRGSPSSSRGGRFKKRELSSEPDIEIEDESWLLGNIIGMTSYILGYFHDKYNLD
jgi:hypothetical protein